MKNSSDSDSMDYQNLDAERDDFESSELDNNSDPDENTDNQYGNMQKSKLVEHAKALKLAEFSAKLTKGKPQKRYWTEQEVSIPKHPGSSQIMCQVFDI